MAFKSLKEALDSYFKREIIHAGHGRICEKCRTDSKLSKESFIEDPPKVLMLHLKRFSLGQNGYSAQKNNSWIEFPEIIQLGKFTAKQGVRNSSPFSRNQAVYKLVATINHEGMTSDCGHYIAYLKSLSSESWYVCNDSLVDKVEFYRVKHSKPYILLYINTENLDSF